MKKKTNSKQYKTSIASRKQIIDLLIKVNKPLSFDEILKRFEYTGNKDKAKGMSRRLIAMERDGQVLKNRRNNYGIPAKMDLIIGTVEGHAEGFGFLIPDDGSKDLYLHFNQMRRLLHGDRILAQAVGVNQRGKPEAKLVEVLERANKQLVVRFLSGKGVGIGIPVNSRIKHEILIPPDAQKGAKNNQMVLVEIIQQPDKRFGPIAKVKEILGDHMAPGMEIEVAIHAWNIPNKWPDKVQDATGSIPSEVTTADEVGRVDITDIPLVTIDGADARDFDDAIWCETTSDGWRAIVAIADVSHYVKIDSSFDEEAKLRGTSVYFPEYVVPMLPEVLSNGICSLNPDVKRCAMVCEMQISKQGKVTNSKFYPAIMRSHARLTYNEVGDFFAGKQNSSTPDFKKLPAMTDLYNLYQALRQQRNQRGAIAFSREESKIEFGEDKKIARIVPVIRNDAHKLVEELMVAANVCAGGFIQKHKIPGLYRVHETPSIEKAEGVRDFLKEFGLKLGGGLQPKPADYLKVLQQVKGRPELDLIQTVLLKSMRRAHYTPINEGHFALAHEVYAHFTSPIRRYPDLLVHRAIRHILNKDKVKDYHYSETDMQKLGDNCSTTERRADDATRDVDDWLKCEYMQDKVGEIFDGIIASVTNFGLFVRLNDTHIDGLLHISMLAGDYYHFDAMRHCLQGESTGNTYKLGDSLKIKVIRVDLDERKIDFSLADTPAGASRPKRKSRKSKHQTRSKGKRRSRKTR